MRIALCILLGLVGWGLAPGLLAQDRPAPDDAAAMNRRLGRGINMGNMLEAPEEGAWGLKLDEAYFGIIRQAGFDSVRIPIRWSAHTARQAPYAIDPGFLQRVQRAVRAALDQGLVAVVNVHHFDELYEDPDGQRDRFLAIWRQIASHFQDQPPELFFELLNEPHGDLDAERWNSLLAAALAVVRKTNPQRMVVIGPAEWNNLRALEKLELPEGDDRLIATFHYYLPFHFTHQGASWAEGSQAWLGTTWTGTEAERKAVVDDLQRAADWARRHGRPLFLGEFGSYSRADMASRQRWTAFLRGEAERRGISWAYWEFGSGFGAYDPQAQAWRAPLLEALVPADNHRQ